MKTLNEQIERLRELIRKCYGVVAGKNGIVPEVGERNMENLPAAIASTHDTLEELTITQNGEYTPQEGVDGFSKVTAEFDTSSLPKVKVSSLSVNNSCINDNGVWEGGGLLDTSILTSLSKSFYICSNLVKADVSNWDTSNVTNASEMCNRCYVLKSFDVSNWDVSKITNMYSMFSLCESLESLDVSNWDVSNVTSIRSTFGSCAKLIMLDLTKWNVSNVTNVIGTDTTFRRCYDLKSLIGNRTIEDVINNNICCLKGLKLAASNMFSEVKLLDRASLRALINGLADLTGQTAQTLTLGATLIAKLTEEDIAIAVSKNWTIV